MYTILISQYKISTTLHTCVQTFISLLPGRTSLHFITRRNLQNINLRIIWIVAETLNCLTSFLLFYFILFHLISSYFILPYFALFSLYFILQLFSPQLKTDPHLCNLILKEFQCRLWEICTWQFHICSLSISKEISRQNLIHFTNCPVVFLNALNPKDWASYYVYVLVIVLTILNFLTSINFSSQIAPPVP